MGISDDPRKQPRPDGAPPAPQPVTVPPPKLDTFIEHLGADVIDMEGIGPVLRISVHAGGMIVNLFAPAEQQQAVLDVIASARRPAPPGIVVAASNAVERVAAAERATRGDGNPPTPRR